MFINKLHHIKQGAAIDKRILNEAFMHFAKQFNSIGVDNIALITLERDRFEGDSFDEIWWNRTTNKLSFDHDFTESPRLESESLNIRAGFAGTYAVDWSLNLKDNGGGTNTFIKVVPYAAGRLLWAAADLIQHEWPLTPSGGNGDFARTTYIPQDAKEHSLSGRTQFSTNVGSFDVGLIAGAEARVSNWFISKYTAKNVQISVRRIR